MDNTTFGGDIPSLPQWTGAPRATICVQAMLYASLAASLFSAFLAMLGKQWLNRYALTDMRGTAVERSQDRQRKLGGIIAWYFGHVMESLPLMLQFALLLLGCALSLYLWDINATVACVVIGVTGLGVIFYIFFVIAGTASASCPYQTPWAHVLRYILPIILRLLHSASHGLIRKSRCLVPFSDDEWFKWRDWKRAIFVLSEYILCLPFSLACDAYQLTRAMARALIALARRVYSWIRSARSAQAHGLNQRAAALDSQCVSWILQTSLEKDIRLSTLKFLATTPTLVDFTPALLSDCFDIFIDCVRVDKQDPVIVQGMEHLGEASAMCLFLAYSHLSIINPTSGILSGIRQRYRRIFPLDLDFNGLPFPHTLYMAHEAIYSGRKVKTPVGWRGHKPTNNEQVTVSHVISKLPWPEYQRRGLGKVPRPCLSFALHYISQDPLPPPSVITDCLLIIAIDLGCDVQENVIFAERCVRVWRISTTLLTDIQHTARGDF